jgi:hypothetical protein
MSRADDSRPVKEPHQWVAAHCPRIDDLPDIPDGEPFAEEWKAFKREAIRLVNEGNTGRFAVFKGERLLGVWDTLADAEMAGRQQFDDEPFLVQEVQLYLKPLRWGYSRPCRA